MLEMLCQKLQNNLIWSNVPNASDFELHFYQKDQKIENIERIGRTNHVQVDRNRYQMINN